MSFLTLCFLAVALLMGCAASTPAPVLPSGAGNAAPWAIPAAELGTQRLFRVTYDGPQGDGSFKLTLRLVSAERYRALASDPLGRPLWTLDVAGDGGLWLDHRERLACRLEGRFDLAAAHLAPFPLSSLPALLLGRVPAAPAGAVERRDGDVGGADVDYRDADRRRWTVRVGAAGTPESWTLWHRGEPAVWWRGGTDAGSTLSDRRRGTQLRWRQVVREPLVDDGGLGAAAVPEGYAAVDCGAAI